MFNPLASKSHVILSVENPVYKPKLQAPTHEQALRWLKAQGENAMGAVGHYGSPERSIIIENPKNLEGIKQLAQDIGQESILHSKEGQHELHYLNGPKKGQIVHGTGTNVFAEPPLDLYTTVTDENGDAVHFSHNLNFPPELIQKSEVLEKAPFPYKEYDLDQYVSEQKGLPDLMGDDEYKHIKSVKLPNGLEYRQFKSKNALKHQQKIVHALYDPKDNLEPLAYMETSHAEDATTSKGYHPHAVNWSEVNPLHRGKGLGRQMYLAALVHGKGRLTSDERVSPEAHKMWQSFKSYPGLGGKLSSYGYSNQGGTDERHHVFVRDKGKLDYGKMFPPVNLNINTLAASERGTSESLEKAVHPNDWKNLQDSHNRAIGDSYANKIVDAQGHINYFNKEHSEYKKLLGDKKVHKAKYSAVTSGVEPSADDIGSTSKMIHSPAKQSTYMAKPYHQELAGWDSDWVQHPIQGWASLTTKKLFDSAGMGDLAEDIAGHVHNGVPLVVSKFHPEAKESYSSDYHSPLNDLKISIMDFLTHNQDRHGGNVMVANGKPLAIDHERNFQYFGSKFADPVHSPYWAMDHSNLKLANAHTKSWKSHNENLVDWWNHVGHDIKKEMDRNLQYIKHPDVKRHIADNFNDRWEWLNNNMKHPDRLFDKNTPGVETIPYVEQRRKRAM